MKYVLAVLLCVLLAACGGESPSQPGATVAAPIVASAASAPAVVAPIASVPVAALAPVAPVVVPPVAPVAPLPIPAPVPASAPVAPVPSVVAPPSKVVLIDVYGDDAMFGMTSMMGFPTDQTEPNDTQALLRAQFGDGVTITNHATGGTSSSLQNEMLGIDGQGAPFAHRIMASPASIVIDNHAMNDALGGETIDDYRAWLVQWVTAVRAAGKLPVLEEPNPVCDGNHPQLGDYVAAMDDVAAQMKVPLVQQYKAILALPNWHTHMNSCFYPDAWLYQIKAQAQAAVFSALISAVPN
jgi:hypothetical protein